MKNSHIDLVLVIIPAMIVGVIYFLVTQPKCLRQECHEEMVPVTYWIDDVPVMISQPQTICHCLEYEAK